MPELPVPPTSGTSKKEAARIRLECAKFYYTEYFQNGPLDPVSFIDRIMTDYSTYEPDVLGDWISNMSPLYKLHKAFINYVIQHGSTERIREGRQYENVIHPGMMYDG